ncbi:MAG: alpha/beta hydrolase [Thermoanaerobaculia bacterium]
MPDAAPVKLSSLEIPGPAGPLEALLRSPEIPAGAALVAHPHPRLGGTMRTKVVHRAARLLSGRFRLAALRFHFRGVGASAGTYDGGAGETEDLVAAARWLRARQPDGPFVLAGFSFGALCALRAAERLGPDVLLLIGLPTDRNEPDAVVPEGTRVLWIQGEDDGFSSAARARDVAAARGWKFLVVPGGDHFFSGRLDEFERMTGDALARWLPTS